MPLGEGLGVTLGIVKNFIGDGHTSLLTEPSLTCRSAWSANSAERQSAACRPGPRALQDLPPRVVARRARHAAARVRPRAAQEQARDRRRVARPSRYRPQREQLVQPKIAVEDVAAGQRVLPLEIEWRQGVDVLDRAAN